MHAALCNRPEICICLSTKKKRDTPHALRLFFKKVGVPDVIVCDQGKEQVEGKSLKLLRNSGTMVRTLEPNAPWAN